VLLEDGTRSARSPGARLGALGVARARRRGVRRGLAGVALAGALVAISAVSPSAGIAPGDGQVDWRGWDPFAGGGSGDVRFLWDASYDGHRLSHPADGDAPDPRAASAQYWRMSTLETFTDDRWIEHLFPVSLGKARARLPRSPLAPRRDLRPGTGSGRRSRRRPRRHPCPAATEPARVGRASLDASGSCRAA
jgi:hypothetical protein